MKHEISHILDIPGHDIKNGISWMIAHWRTTLKFWTTDGAFMVVIIITIIIKPAASPWNCCKSSLRGVQSPSKGVKSATHLYCKQYQNYYLSPFLLVCPSPIVFFSKKVDAAQTLFGPKRNLIHVWGQNLHNRTQKYVRAATRGVWAAADTSCSGKMVSQGKQEQGVLLICLAIKTCRWFKVFWVESPGSRCVSFYSY